MESLGPLMSYILFALLMLVASALVYFIRKHKSKEEPDEDFEILEE